MATKPTATIPQPTFLHPMPDVRTRTKSNEEVIREELRSTGDGYMKVWQSGMTLLPALMVALFYFRRETVQSYIAVGKMKVGQMLPIDIYLIGTLFVAVVCVAFCLILRLIGNRYRCYSALLKTECVNALPLPLPSKWGLGRGLFYLTLIVFPLIDVALYLIYQWRLQIDFAVLAR